eukprot:NODE_1849_length_1281_cov_3.819805_g1531_i0.p1 GENE.NODE_1849_length_1281_cov_3.819805_g1531_i0~~NODE_1849_length_1281_cov_3.819805_g1531_i0.p1  ORF type:complete len:191 (-),score=21.86 NODE_1849_length_1281_cov_3.819805_g1531_i0:151-723(-)
MLPCEAARQRQRPEDVTGGEGGGAGAGGDRRLLNTTTVPVCAEVGGCGNTLRCFSCDIDAQMEDCSCGTPAGAGVSVTCPEFYALKCASSSSEKSLLLLLLLLLLLIPFICCCLAFLLCCIRRKKAGPPTPLPLTAFPSMGMASFGFPAAPPTGCVPTSAALRFRKPFSRAWGPWSYHVISSVCSRFSAL